MHYVALLSCPTLPYVAVKLPCIALRLKVEFLVGGGWCTVPNRLDKHPGYAGLYVTIQLSKDIILKMRIPTTSD